MDEESSGPALGVGPGSPLWVLGGEHFTEPWWPLRKFFQGTGQVFNRREAMSFLSGILGSPKSGGSASLPQ